ncbi:MAG: hypothetical protein M3Q44_02665 [bacterium]|nr:hypothetical protein [bacterium]
MELHEFRDYLRIFTTTHDANLHKTAILQMLDPLDLDIEYKKLNQDGGLNRVMDIFASFSEIEDDDLVTEYERKSLEQVGALTREYFKQKAYSSFAKMVFALTLESFAEKYDLGLDEDQLTEVRVEDVYNTIPSEIYLQTFLLESMSDESAFNWNRDTVIIEQSLLALTVCFSDIYAFLTEDDEYEEEVAD